MVQVEACAVCTHSRTEHLRGRLACSYVIDEQAACSCAEFAELPPTREGTVGCKHGWQGTLLACPRCQMEAPTDWSSTFWVVLILACNAVFLALAGLVLAGLI
jgi:hypothetical protein